MTTRYALVVIVLFWARCVFSSFFSAVEGRVYLTSIVSAPPFVVTLLIPSNRKSSDFNSGYFAAMEPRAML